MNELNDFFKALAEAKAKDPKRKIVSEVKESIKEDLPLLFSALTKASGPSQIAEEKAVEEKPIEEKVIEPIVEEKPIEQPRTPEESQQGVERYLKALPKTSHSFQQPLEQPVAPEFKAITEKLKFLEQAIGKIVATGPGGGAGEIYNLDMPTKIVTGDYAINRKDYYIGVNCSVKCSIILPTPGRNLKNGRVVVIKDESGHAQLTPIKIVGTIDNDPNGAELRINNGAIQLIYRDGWRII